MKRSALAVSIGIVFSFVVFVSLFIVDLKMQLSPAGKFAIGRFKPENTFSIMEEALDVFLFVFFPLTAILVGVIVSFVAKTRLWLCSALAMLPIVVFFYIEGVATSYPLFILKSTYSAISCLAFAGLIGVFIQRIKT